MPGSPPSRITEPGTSPPPVTRSSSAIPTAVRGGSWPVAARLWKAICRPLGAGLRAVPAPMPVAACSSTMEFQAPQASHLPCQRLLVAPQFWQTKAFRDLLMRAPRPGGRIPSRCRKGRGWGRARQAPVPSPI